MSSIGPQFAVDLALRIAQSGLYYHLGARLPGIGSSVGVSGLAELHRDLTRAGKETDAELRVALRGLGDLVRDDARSRFSSIDAGSAAGFRTRVRGRPVVAYVEQSKRRTTGQHPEYGPLQMRRALIPAVQSHEAVIEREIGRAVDRAIKSAGF